MIRILPMSLTLLLRTVRPHLTVYAALQIYKTMILPILEYGSALYAGAANKHVSKLQTLQNSGLRAVFGLPRLTPTCILHTKAGIDKLELRREKATLLLAYDRSSNSHYLDPRGINTRAHGAPTLVVPRCRTGQAQRAAGYRSSTAWNKLPPEIRNEKKRKYAT